MTLKIRTQVSSRNCTRRSGLAKAGRLWSACRAAITTRLPVPWAVKSLPRLKKPITSTMPATALSRGGSRLCNRATSGLSCDGYAQGCWELDSGDIDIFPLRSRLRPRDAVGEAIDGNLRNNDAEAHR